MSYLPETGQMVQVRSRRWIVTNIATSQLPLPNLQVSPSDAQNFVSLASIEDDSLGEELEVIWEIEPGTQVVDKIALPDPTGFDSPARLDAFLDAVRWGASSSADVRNVQAPFRSGIKIEDYQLDPVVRAIQMPRVNLLIADDVGLGKTIEAGMVALELMLRHRARKILIVCPSSLQIQWRDQMRDKFGLEFRIVDSDLMRELRRSRGIHVNPWKHFPRLITSIDFLKRERPLRLFRELLPGPNESIYPRRFDLLICDEAHNCAPSGRGRYATDSLRTQALRELAPHFEHKLFLTATPHNGYPESFSALLELLDNQRFARSTIPDRKQLNAVMIRRMKSELPPNWDGSPRFPKRTLEPIEVPYTDEEKSVHADLNTYTQLRVQRSKDSSERVATEFVLKTLKKRLFSSPEAFLTTLSRHEQTLRTPKKVKTLTRPTIGVLKRELDRMDEEYASDNDYDEATQEALDTASQLFTEPTAEELQIIKRMKDWAENASRRQDSKARCLIHWLTNHLRPGGKWLKDRVIIFTEYRATQNWLKEILAAEGFTAGDRLKTMYGGMNSDDREEVKNAFQASPEISPVRILLATDAASEGLDLQNHCSKLIHYEIPWNPNRLEQRNGRIDRHGQKAREVEIFHFVAEGYRNRRSSPGGKPSRLEADLEFLMVVANKVEAIREDLGSYGIVIADEVESAMLGGSHSLERLDRAEVKADPVRKMLKFEHDLKKRVADLLAQFRETEKEQRLFPGNIQKVVEIALSLADQPHLIPSQSHRGRPVYILPALRGSWAACAEGLEHPHTHDMRPITFDHKESDDRDDVVLVHLNHRLVQMCLRLLRAEVWSTNARKRLHRIAARLVPERVFSNPAIVAYARLVIIGGDSHRLHEELICMGGEIKEGRFSRMSLGQLEDALASQNDREPSDSLKQKLLSLWDKLLPGLAQSLEARMKDRVEALKKKLVERAEKETSDIESILTELKQAIELQLNEPDYQQLELPLFNQNERDQLERNRDFLRSRVKAIPEEIERETAAIRARFAQLQSRLFPVAVTFLVPENLAKGQD